MPRAPGSATPHQRGAGIEAHARALLQAHGLSDVASNAGYRVGEIDLVMCERSSERSAAAHPAGAARAANATLVFVEVRYRRSSAFGGGAASVDRGKRRRLIRAAESFLLAHPEFADAHCRFDVVAASGDADAPTLQWIKDAFRADDI